MPGVVIAGAGPAGLACALWLAREGVEVTVLESAPALRERPCGEGMMPPGVDLLADLGVLEAVRTEGAREFRGISYWMDGAEAARGDFPDRPGRQPRGLGVPRPGLERVLLAALGRTASCRVHLATPVTGLLRSEGRVVGVESGSRRFRADGVVAADGRGSTVRRLLGLERPSKRPERFGVCGHFEWFDGHLPLSHVEVHLVEGGEVYRTPTGERSEGWIYLTDAARVRRWAPDLKGRFLEHVKGSRPLAEALQGATARGTFAGTGPLHRPSAAAGSEGVLLAGDAAGFLDALTGEGLALGLRSARQAARLLLESGCRIGDAEARRHDAGWRDATRQPWLLTRALMFLVRHRSLGRLVLARMRRHPELMGRLLAVNSGDAKLQDLDLRSVLALLVG